MEDSKRKPDFYFLDFLLPRHARQGFDFIKKTAANFLFPPICIGCKSIVSHDGTLCASCWNGIRFIEKPYCPVMGTPFSHDLGKYFLSAEALSETPPFARLRSATIHQGLARHMTILLKFHDRTDLAPWMARWMLRAGEELITDCDMIIPVPLHRWRFWRRRFNQSAELSRHLAHFSSKPLCVDILERSRNTRQQTTLSASQRKKNVDGAFRVAKEKQAELKGRHILLIDDVYTTGATLRAATRCLSRYGAAQIDVLTFSRVLKE